MLSKQYPPLKSWIITLSIGVFLFVICTICANKYGGYIVNRRHKIEANYLLENAINNITRNPEKVQVVAIGSSLVGHGIACTPEYENQYTEVCLNKIFLNTNTEILKTFADVGVFDSLLIHLPDILLIEVDQLAYRVEEELSFKDYFFKGAYFLYNIKSTFAMNTGNYRMPEYCGKIVSGSLSDTNAYEYIHRNSVAFNDRNYIHGALKKLSNQGVKIYLIHIPRPFITESVLHKGEQQELFLKLMNNYQNELNTTYIEFPEKLGFHYFYDFGHLNDVGRKKYSDWLYASIIKANE